MKIPYSLIEYVSLMLPHDKTHVDNIVSFWKSNVVNIRLNIGDCHVSNTFLALWWHLVVL